jgi:hypothetical protein
MSERPEDSAGPRQRTSGDVLGVDLDPETTSDERDDTDAQDEQDRMRRMLEDVPPHHGD